MYFGKGVMKIVLFTDTIGDLNGVSRFLQDMAELSLKREDDLQIVTSTRKYCPAAENIHNFIPYFRIPMPFYTELDLAFPPSSLMEDFVHENKPDLIHISTPGPVGMAGRKIAKKLAIPMLGTYHTDFPAYIRDNTGSQLLKRATDLWMRCFYKPFIHVFSRSQAYTYIMQHDIGVAPEKISYIRAGTNLERFAPRHKNTDIWNSYGTKKDSVKILYVGRITKEKNVPFLLDVWTLFKKSYPHLNAELVMVGEGSLKKRVLGMKPIGVHYLGPITGKDLSKIYASSDIFAFPSVTDTLGQVVMESAASALPIIVSTTGGPKSLISPHPRSGYALDIDVELWVDHIRLLVENKELRHALGESGQAYMKAFPIGNSYKDFIGVHKEHFKSMQG